MMLLYDYNCLFEMIDDLVPNKGLMREAEDEGAEWGKLGLKFGLTSSCTMPLYPLTVLQDRIIGYVALVGLMLRRNRRKLDIARVEDGGQSAVNTAQLLQK